jgi:hypothetical protein
MEFGIPENPPTDADRCGDLQLGRGFSDLADCRFPQSIARVLGPEWDQGIPTRWS